MTISEAMKLSKETGQAFCRGGGWSSYKETFLYEFNADDIMADDFEMLGSAGASDTPEGEVLT